MEIRKLDRDNMKSEYGAFTQRLMPWPAINAPFQGAWCVIAPGGASTPHEHHEYEVFVAISGSAVLEANGERSPFTSGDVAFMPPGTYHTVINETDTDFQFYSVWWDAEMTEKFAARHTAESATIGPTAS